MPFKRFRGPKAQSRKDMVWGLYSWESLKQVGRVPEGVQPLFLGSSSSLFGISCGILFFVSS